MEYSCELHPLLKELKQNISEIENFDESKKNSSDIHIETKYQRSLARLCYSLELILNDGLKDISLFGSTFFWNYLENLDKCLPGPVAKNILGKVKEINKGNLGRGRVFIRLTLNDGTLAEYIKALSWNSTLTESFYKEDAILRSDNLLNSFLSLLDITTTLKFNFVIKDKNLDDPDYWNKLTRKSSILNSTTLMAPDNLISLKIGRSPSFSNLETMNSIVETAESMQKELEESKNTIFQFKIQYDVLKNQLDAETKEKKELAEKYNKLEKDFNSLIQTVRDLGIELNIYKSHYVPTITPIADQNLTSTDSVSTESLFPGTLDQNGASEELDKINENFELFNKAQLCIQQMKRYDSLIKEKLYSWE